MSIQFHKVLALPGTLAPNAFYYVENGTYAEAYITNQSGVARSIGNSTMINTLIDERFAASANTFEIVGDIAARDTLTSASQTNVLILVNDASADPTVDAGAAFFSYDAGTDTVTKIAEFESLDVQLTWDSITGGPASSPDDIDEAVNDRHVHDNAGVLDLLSVANGRLQYDEADVCNTFTTNAF